MKYLILGCNGMAGHTITLYLHKKGYCVMGYAREKSKFVETIIGDANDLVLLRKTILEGKFDVIINCIGILNDDAENFKANAVFLNAYLPHFLVHLTSKTLTKVIHISTDCVFSGDKGNYTEYDFPDGKSFYDRSKALGEFNDKKNLTLRNSIIGPDMNPRGIGLLNWFMQQKNEVTGYSKTIWTGQTTLQLAKTIEKLTTIDAVGLINAVPASSISKFELLELFSRYFKNNSIKIMPSSVVKIDKSLLRTNFAYDFTVPNYEHMIKELAEWIEDHKELYPHY